MWLRTDASVIRDAEFDAVSTAPGRRRHAAMIKLSNLFTGQW
jgi:hypothetical protein